MARSTAKIGLMEMKRSAADEKISDMERQDNLS
jgi:hypothetical protein